MAQRFEDHRLMILSQIGRDLGPTYWPWQIETIELPAVTIEPWRIATAKLTTRRENTNGAYSTSQAAHDSDGS